eukprot:1063123-Pelagomonas_calceolata.AAC.1
MPSSGRQAAVHSRGLPPLPPPTAAWCSFFVALALEASGGRAQGRGASPLYRRSCACTGCRCALMVVAGQELAHSTQATEFWSHANSTPAAPVL